MNISMELMKINKWWKSARIDETFLYKNTRSEYNDIVAKLQERRILAIVGPRRVGKSTLLLQTINHLLIEGVEAKRILFFSADDPAVFFGKNTIGAVIEEYANEILHENISDATEKIYIFIDEIHKQDDWQLWLKSYYDRQNNIKFIVSGSSATHLFEGSKESLLGRIENVQVLPLSFTEFCRFHDIYRGSNEINGFLKILPKLSVYEYLQEYYEELKSKELLINELKPYVNRILKEFLLAGGYPEYFETNSSIIWQKRLTDDVIGQGLYRDVITIHKIKSPDKLEKLLYLIAANNGQSFAFKTIADTIEVDTVTATNYLSYLSQAFLICLLENYSNNIATTIRKNKKIYLLDNGILNALLRNNEIEQAFKGQLIEGNCVSDVIAVAQKNFWKVHYFRNKAAEEVDIILNTKNSLLPIEVKYRNSPKDIKGLKSFMNEFQCKEGLCISKDLLDKQGNIYFIPYWMIR